jgi:L-fuconolactonase
MIVDAHVHLWDAAHTPQPWMTAEHEVIARPFAPSDLRPLLDRNGVDAVVVVQGACLDSDTDQLLAEASEHV